jgi:lipoprotein signal peptidase
MTSTTQKSSLSFHWIAWPGIVTLALDQGLKAFTASQMRPYQAFPILGQKWISWTRVPNSGLLFQKFEMVYSPENTLWTRYLPALALLLTAIFFIRTLRLLGGHQVSKLVSGGFSVFWFGGFSNVLSHFLSVFVDDTVAAQLWPGSKVYIFNIADLGITLGMACVFASMAILVVADFRLASQRKRTAAFSN